MCLATFAVNYNVCYSISKDDDIAGIEETDEEEEIDNDDKECEKQFNIQPTITTQVQAWIHEETKTRGNTPNKKIQN